MPVRTDLNAAFRPTGPSGGSASPGASTGAPSPTVDQLINKAVNGTLTPTEATQLQAMLDSPAMKSAFTEAQRQGLERFAKGKGLPPRDAKELHSDLKLLKGAKELPARFAADLLLAHEALLEHPLLLRADKATRLFEFAMPYAQALAELQPAAAELRAAAQGLLAEAEKAGFKALERQGDGKSGMEALAALLKAATAHDVAHLAKGQRFDAPSWPKDAPPVHLEAIGAAKAGEQLIRPPPQVLQPPVQIVRRPEEAERSKAAEGTSKRLGPMMLWNALHRLRDAGEDGQDSAAQREAMTQLAVAAGLILAFLAIVVGVLVAL